MSRRPATCFSALSIAAIATIALSGCGGGNANEHVAPPPIAASKPAESPQSAPTPSTTTAAPATAPDTRPSAPSTVVVVEPALTPGTSLPGAIPPSPAPDTSTAQQQKPSDPLQWLKDSEARKAEYRRRLSEAEAGVVNANTKAAEWERNLLAFKNPFLARPQLSPADSQAIAGMGGAERAQWAEGKLAEARAERNAAQKALDDLKANPPLN